MSAVVQRVGAVVGAVLLGAALALAAQQALLTQLADRLVDAAR